MEVGDLLPSSQYAERMKRVPKAWRRRSRSTLGQRMPCGRHVPNSSWQGCMPPIGFRGRRNMEGSAMKSERREPGGIIHSYQNSIQSSFLRQRAKRPIWSARHSSTCSCMAPARIDGGRVANAIHLDPSQIAGLGPSIDTPRPCSRNANGESSRSTKPILSRSWPTTSFISKQIDKAARQFGVEVSPGSEARTNRGSGGAVVTNRAMSAASSLAISCKSPSDSVRNIKSSSSLRSTHSPVASP